MASGIQTSFFGILMLLFTAVTERDDPSFTVRVADEITLPCGNLKKDQLSCGSTSWLFAQETAAVAVELITDGNISKNEKAKAKSKRLKVTADCSLVITNVTDQDYGRYTCRQFKAGQPHGEDAQVFLSVVNMVSHGVLFYCTVITYDGCWHSVQWLYEGDKNTIEISPGTCTTWVTLKYLDPDQKTLKNFKESLKCSVTDQRSGRSLQMKASPQSSAEEKEGSTSKEDTTEGKTQTQSAWSPLPLKAAGLAALFMTLVIVEVYIWRRTKGMKTQRDGDTVDPGDGAAHSLNQLHLEDQQ